MKNRDGSAPNDNWQTPKWLYDKLNKEFNFDFDPCPYTEDEITPNNDGLLKEWGKSNFINPPYNRIDKPKFIQKAFEQWQQGKTCVLLIPVSTSTKQFHEIILPNAEVRFLKGRVAFSGYNEKGIFTDKNKGKHDSMVVIFRADLCGIVYPRDDSPFNNSSSCLRTNGHSGEHVCKLQYGGLVAWQYDDDCCCYDCVNGEPTDACIIYRDVKSIDQVS